MRPENFQPVVQVLVLKIKRRSIVSTLENDPLERKYATFQLSEFTTCSVVLIQTVYFVQPIVYKKQICSQKSQHFTFGKLISVIFLAFFKFKMAYQTLINFFIDSS